MAQRFGETGSLADEVTKAASGFPLKDASTVARQAQREFSLKSWVEHPDAMHSGMQSTAKIEVQPLRAPVLLMAG